MDVLNKVNSSQARRLIVNCLERAGGWPIFEALWDREFSPTERRALGFDTPWDAYQAFGVPAAWEKLRHQTGARAAVEIMFALGGLDQSQYRWLLSELGEDESWTIQVERAAASGALVLVEGEMEAFWNRCSISCDWSKYPRLWAFLIAVAQAAKRGECCDQLSLGRSDSENVLKHRKYHLSKLPNFPASLAGLIRAAGQGSYRLYLEPERIRIFEQVGLDEYRELIP